MSRFNILMQNAFHGCMAIGLGYDAHRGRHINLYAIPGDFEHVGVYDGVDAWIATAIMNPFGLDAAKRLAEIQQGAVFEIEQGQTRMRYADGTYQREGGEYNPAGGQPRPGLSAKPRKRLGGAIAAQPLPLPTQAPATAPRARIRIGMTAADLLGKPKERRRVV